MKSIYKTKILQGHSRPIKDIQFSHDGKYIFSASSDRSVIKWDHKDNNKCFTYNHQASVNVICISRLNNFMFSGDSTGCIYIWDTDTNNLKRKIMFNGVYNIRSIALSVDEEFIIITFAERSKKSNSFIEIYLVKDIVTQPETEPAQETQTNDSPPGNCFKKIECSDLNTKFVKSLFTNKDKNILVSREDGVLEMFDFPEGKLISSEKFHNNEILDFDVNDEQGLVITSSKDGEMSLINLNTFQLLNKFKPTNPIRNLNACKIIIVENPFYKIPGLSKGISIDTLFDLNTLDLAKMNYIEKDLDDKKGKKYGNKKELILAITSGGQDSKFVTTTDQKEGGFEIIVYNAITGEKLVDFLDHFGPVNTLSAFQKTLASGAEDATVRVHSLDHYLFS